MTRVRLPVATGWALGAEGGFSSGEYDAADCFGEICSRRWRWQRAYFGHLGLLGETRSAGGFSLRGSFGFAAVFNLVDGRCDDCQVGDSPDLWDTTVPYADMAVGWALPL